MKNDSLARQWDQSLIGPGSPLTAEEWRELHGKLKDHADAMATLMNNTARKISADAGLDPNFLGIHPHNAMWGKENGQPWDGVDYNRVQAVLDLLKIQFSGSNVVREFDKAVRIDPHRRWLEKNKD